MLDGWIEIFNFSGFSLNNSWNISTFSAIIVLRLFIYSFLFPGQSTECKELIHICKVPSNSVPTLLGMCLSFGVILISIVICFNGSLIIFLANGVLFVNFSLTSSVLASIRSAEDRLERAE